jgi:hypothetical protein
MYSIADMVSWIGAMESRAKSSTLRISSSDKLGVLADATRKEMYSDPNFLCGEGLGVMALA